MRESQYQPSALSVSNIKSSLAISSLDSETSAIDSILLNRGLANCLKELSGIPA
jgi:hypothetical protein